MRWRKLRNSAEPPAFIPLIIMRKRSIRPLIKSLQTLKYPADDAPEYLTQWTAQMARVLTPDKLADLAVMYGQNARNLAGGHGADLRPAFLTAGFADALTQRHLDQ
jgi:hypothetical protein